MALRTRASDVEHFTCADHADTDAEMPHGYSERAAWMSRKGVTHLQYACPQCGLYAIWLPRETVQAIRDGRWSAGAASRESGDPNA